MSYIITSPQEALEVESRLLQTKDLHDQADLIEILLDFYVFTNTVRARDLLEKQRKLLTQGVHQDLTLRYFIHLANLESQQYNFKEARQALEKALAMLPAAGDFSDRIEVYLDYVGALINADEMELAGEYFDRCERLLESYPSDRMRARAKCRIGFLYLHFYSYPKATVKFLEADQLLSGGTFELTLKDHYFYTLVHSGLGSAWMSSDANKAAEGFYRAIERCEKMGLKGRVSWHYLNLASVWVAQGLHEKAAPYFQAVIDQKGNGGMQVLAAAYANLGICYLELEKDDELIKELLTKAEEIYHALPDTDFYNLINIRRVRASLMGSSNEAIKYLREILETTNEDKYNVNPRIIELRLDVYRELAHKYSKNGKYKEAYECQMAYDDLRNQYQMFLDAELQKKSAAQFNAEIREQETEKLKLKASQLQLRALRAQMNPHFLYNALNSIQSFMSTNDASTASKYLAKFAMLMRRSLEYTNRDYITLEEEIAFLTDYLEINCHLRFDGMLKFDVHIDSELEEDIIGVPTMIIQPYVENAIEHGLRSRKNGYIKVEFCAIKDVEDTIQVVITDDGVGREAVRLMQEKDSIRPFHKSRGTEITESRLALLAKDNTSNVKTRDLFDEITGVSKGTEVSVYIPVTDVLPRKNHLV